jgi:tetratricopeptide (TPR) repeat protein
VNLANNYFSDSNNKKINMKELSNCPRENKGFDDEIETLKKCLASEKDKKKSSTLYAKLWHVYYRKGAGYFDQGDYKAALQHHLKALEFIEYVEREGVFNLLMSVGIEYEKMGEYDQAISYYKRLIGSDNTEKADRVMLLQFIGQCYDKKGEEKVAYDYFKKLFSITQRYDGEWYLVYRYAKLAYKYREFDTSLCYFNAALKILPTNERHYIQSSLQCLGYILLEKKEYKQAITHFKRALKIKTGLDKVEAEIMSGMAQAYFGRNKFSQAIKCSKNAIKKTHDDEISERSYFLLAFCYSVKKDKEKEQYYKEKLQGLRPNSPYLRDLL